MLDAIVSHLHPRVLLSKSVTVETTYSSSSLLWNVLSTLLTSFPSIFSPAFDATSPGFAFCYSRTDLNSRRWFWRPIIHNTPLCKTVGESGLRLPNVHLLNAKVVSGFIICPCTVGRSQDITFHFYPFSHFVFAIYAIPSICSIKKNWSWYIELIRFFGPMVAQRTARPYHLIYIV